MGRDLLLDADPLKDVRNTRKIRAVVAAGRLYDREAIDRLLSEAEAAAKANHPDERAPEELLKEAETK